MSLKTALFHSIDNQLGDYNWQEAFLTTVTIHPTLAKAIEDSGEEVPKQFNPKEFGSEKHSHIPSIDIKVDAEQDSLIYYIYE